MLQLIITATFIALTLLPQILMAEVSVQDCVASIYSTWPTLTKRALIGETRHKTDCRLDAEITEGRFEVQAEGSPLNIQFSLGESKNSQQNIHFCKVDKEKIHLVFEEVGTGRNDKNEKTQLTLLKRQGTGWSMILSQRKLKVLQHTQHNNLICHLK